MGDREGIERHSPWPGSFYSLPAMVGIIVSLVVFMVAQRWVVARPQINADSRYAIDDVAMRRRSAAVLEAAQLVTLALTLAGFALMTCAATASAAAGSPSWVACAHWGAIVSLGLAGVGLICAARRLIQR